MKILKYGICSNTNHQEFVDACNASISNKWTPLGGISVCSVGATLWYTQAFVKVDTKLTSDPDNSLIEFLENKD